MRKPNRPGPLARALASVAALRLPPDRAVDVLPRMLPSAVSPSVLREDGFLGTRMEALVDLDATVAEVNAALEAQGTSSHGEAFDGITGVSIHEDQEAVDVIVTFLTLGIFSMITVESEGEVRKFTDSSGAGQ